MKIIIMKPLLIILRLPIVILHMLIGLIIVIFFPRDNTKLTKTHYSISIFWMKILIKVFGLKVILKGKINQNSYAYVANHISFLDIIVLNSLLPINFIAKAEIKKWPIVGKLASKTGTLFIKRGDKEASEEIIGIMKNHIDNGNKVLFFPEGRIGNGVNVKKFHSKLFNSISYSGKKIQPIAIRYPKNYPQDLNSDDNVTWSDDSQTLLKVVIQCLGKPSTYVLVNFEKSINTSNLSSHEIAKLSAHYVDSTLSTIA